MKRKIQHIFQQTIYGETITRFEDKMLLLSLLIITLLHVLSVIMNIMMKLKLSIILTSVLGTFVFLSLFCIIRFVSRNIFVYFFTGILSLLFIDVVWFVNYGSNGPVMVFFMVYYAFMILLFDKRYYLAISIILLVNLGILYFFELNHPDLISNYPDRQASLTDNYLGLVIGIVTIFLFMASIKNNYIKEYQRAKMADQLKSAFLANMSHEIRTPLNAIVGFSSLIFDPDMSSDDKKMFEKQIQQNSGYLLELIEDIIDVSKIESNQLTINLREINVVPLINRIVQSFQLSVPEDKGIRIVADLPASLQMNVDQVRLEQIFRNLLSNAVKFTVKGTVLVSCAKDSDWVTFSVEDTGIGINSDYLGIIFDRFIKIENQRQQLFRGTGLGLFLTKQLVELMGGTIGVDSELGTGSKFYFKIPG